MKYEIHEKFGRISKLGFGAMRFPKLADGTIDQQQVNQMIRTAYEAGVNYFDTAYVYGNGASERALGEALRQFPRDSFLLTNIPFIILPTGIREMNFSTRLWNAAASVTLTSISCMP